MVEPYLSRLTRREFLRRIGGGTLSIAAGLSLTACASGPSQTAGPSGQITLPVGTFAGVNNAVIKEKAVPKFQASHPNVNVELSVRAAAEAYPKLRASSDRPFEAVGMWNDTFSALGSKAGLFVKPSEANVPLLKDALPDVQPKNGLGLAVAVQPYGIAYNPKFVEKPKSWLDLFNPKYQGRVAMHENFWDQYVMLAYILGTDERNLEVAVNEWAKHKQNIGVWTNSFTQLEELVDKGEMWLGPQWGGFTVAAKRRGLNIDFAWPEEGCTQQSIIVHINKGFPPKVQEAAEQFANLWLDPEVQLEFLLRAGVSPTNTKVAIPAEYAQYEGIITPDRLKNKKLRTYDYAYVGENLPNITQLINEKLK